MLRAAGKSPLPRCSLIAASSRRKGGRRCSLQWTQEAERSQGSRHRERRGAAVEPCRGEDQAMSTTATGLPMSWKASRSGRAGREAPNAASRGRG